MVESNTTECTYFSEQGGGKFRCGVDSLNPWIHDEADRVRTHCRGAFGECILFKGADDEELGADILMDDDDLDLG